MLLSSRSCGLLGAHGLAALAHPEAYVSEMGMGSCGGKKVTWLKLVSVGGTVFSNVGRLIKVNNYPAITIVNTDSVAHEMFEVNCVIEGEIPLQLLQKVFVEAVGKSRPSLMSKNITFYSLISSELKNKHLQSLFDGKVLTVRIPNFFPKNLCQTMAEKILENGYDFYSYADKVVGHVGMSFSEIGDSQEKLSEYHSTVLPSIQKTRAVFYPYQAPTDRLRLTLDEVWPHGASLARFHEGKPSYVGLTRVIEAEKDVLPHQDVLHWDGEHVPKVNLKAIQAKTQLAANIYLSVPKTGGDLELWDFGLESKAEYLLKAKGSYGLEKRFLPQPSFTIHPSSGDLILFNPTRFHCIAKGDEKRITASLFVGYFGAHLPLIYWS